VGILSEFSLCDNIVLVRFVKDVGKVVYCFSFLGDVMEYKGLYSFLGDPSDITVG